MVIWLCGREAAPQELTRASNRPDPMPSALAAHVASIAATAAAAWWASARAGAASMGESCVSIKVEGVDDKTGGALPREMHEAIARELRKCLGKRGFATARRKAAAALRIAILSVRSSLIVEAETGAGKSGDRCVVTAIIADTRTGNIVTKLVIGTPGLAGTAVATGETDRAASAMAEAVAEAVSLSLGGARREGAQPAAREDLTATGARVIHLGEGLFEIAPARPGSSVKEGLVDLKRVAHAHDPEIDKDVPCHTDVTLNDRVPALIDAEGRSFAAITLYHVNPPLMGLPSREAGIDRGMDFRDAANLVKGAYSNYVSPVLTNDAERRRLSSHPIGHFYVKAEIPGYPAILTGMTTMARGDAELADLTVGRELGIGGVLLTPQPGRLNSASEALEELALRQRELRVVDGLYFKNVGGRNAGPEYVQEDGNVVFARFIVPPENGRDALAFFVEFVARGGHNIFGSLINRPNKGTGAGCTAFAISWLEAAGVIPFVEEPAPLPDVAEADPDSLGAADFWRHLLRAIEIPWRQIGCDDRVGAAGIVPAGLTIYDLLFHKESRAFIEAASEGLAQKIKDRFGRVAGTLFQFGALTPLRDLVIRSRRRDPQDLGDYDWARRGEGLVVPFWDNSRFAIWIKRLWAGGPGGPDIRLLREGRFRGIEVDVMQSARQQQPFFAEADRIAERKHRMEASGSRPSSPEALFRLGIQ